MLKDIYSDYMHGNPSTLSIKSTSEFIKLHIQVYDSQYNHMLIEVSQLHSQNMQQDYLKSKYD